MTIEPFESTLQAERITAEVKKGDKTAEAQINARLDVTPDNVMDANQKERVRTKLADRVAGKKALKKPAVEREEDPGEEARFEEVLQSFPWSYVAEGANGRYVRTLEDGELESKQSGALIGLYDDQSIMRQNEAGVWRRINPVTTWRGDPRFNAGRHTGLKFLPGKTAEDAQPYYNVWRGLGVVPAKGDWSKMRRHIREVLTARNADDDLWLIGWMAWVLQNLGNIGAKLKVSPVVTGPEGAGKTIVLETFGMIFGRNTISLSKPDQVLGRFNASLAEALFVMLEEAFFAGDPKINGPLKDLLTGRDMMLERKNIDPQKVPNYAHFAIISNADRPVPIDGDSRRYYPIECSGEKIGQQAEWFDPILWERDHGGVEAMAWDLLHWTPPNGDWSFLRRFPRTAAGDRMIAAGLTPLERFLLQWVHQCGGGYGLAAPSLYEDRVANVGATELAEAFRTWSEENVRLRHEKDGLKSDNAAVGLKVRAMFPTVKVIHTERGNEREFPARSELIRVLKLHKNGGYGAYLDRLALAETSGDAAEGSEGSEG